MKLHASGEDYLETILVLQKKLGMVRSVDVARHIGVSKPSVCVAVTTLKNGGFLTMDENHLLHLTDIGREVAERKCIAYRSGTSCAVSYTSLARFFKSSRSYKFLKTIFKPSHCME